MKPTAPSTTRRQFLRTSAMFGTGLLLSKQLRAAPGSAGHQPGLTAAATADFTFAFFSDTHLAAREVRSAVAHNGQLTLEKTCAEINALTPRPTSPFATATCAASSPSPPPTISRNP